MGAQPRSEAAAGVEQVRIGLIMPSSNTCMEPVASAMLRPLAGGVSTHVSRLRVEQIDLGAAGRAQFDLAPMLEAARLLADAEVHVIAWAGTSGSWLGLDRDRELCARIGEATGIPATTSSLALLEAFQTLGAYRIGLAVPYTADVTGRIVSRYAAEGVEVVSERHLDITANIEFDRIPPAVVARTIRAVAAPPAEAVAIVCTNVRAAPLAADLELELGIPVVDSVTATVWRTLDLAGAEVAVAGWGTLAATGTRRRRDHGPTDR
jgi:maleate isomerase